MSGYEIEPMEVNDSESNSSSSSEDQLQEAEVSRAAELESLLEQDKNLYDVHVELIEIYKKLGDLNSMRAAYHRFQNHFPLTPKLWLNWLRDEIKIASSTEEKSKIFDLFEKSVQDYLSVDLWIEYAQFSIGASDLQNTRAILEKGLTAAGLHVSEGSLLWDTLRELELAHLSVTPPDTEKWKEQAQRVAEVFKRQLSVPLMGMENTFQEFQEWSETVPDDIIDFKSVEWGYKNALKILETYKPHEENIMNVQDADQLYENYKKYISILTDPSMKICLYERAVAALCLNTNLWSDYCLFSMQLGDCALEVSKKSLRNCYWCEELWVLRLRILEKLSKPEGELLKCFEDGLSSVSSNGLNLWLGYIEYVRRNLPEEKLDKLFLFASENVDLVADPTNKISRLHARILAKRGDILGARNVWKGILKNPEHKGLAAGWLEFANLERNYGDPSSLRKLFNKALSSCKDWPLYIAEEWIMFERETGTLEEVLKCEAKCKSANCLVQQQTLTVESKSSETQLPNQRKRRQEHNEGNFSNKRRKETNVEHAFELPAKKTTPVEKNPATTVFISNLSPHVNENTLKELFPNAVNVELVLDRKGNSRCFGYAQFSIEEEVMHALARDRELLDGRPVFISNCKPDKAERSKAFTYSTNIEENKLFVRGLPYSKTKQDIEELFKAYNCTDVRIVTHKNGQSKGLAYVEFPNKSLALEALKATDQMKVDDFTISVAVSAPPPKKSTLNSTIKEPIRHARSKLSVPLVPRSVLVKNNGNEAEKVVKTQPKSNADFRNMLLKK